MTAVVHTLKTGVVVPLVAAAGAAISSNSAISAGDFDFRAAGGNANLVEMIQAILELTCQWGSTTGMIAGTIIADVYLVPWDMGGSGIVAIDATGGASYISSNYRVGCFTAHKAALATATDFIFQTYPFDLFPQKCAIYLLNRAQNITANWTLKILPAAAQSN